MKQIILQNNCLAPVRPNANDSTRKTIGVIDAFVQERQASILGQEQKNTIRVAAKYLKKFLTESNTSIQEFVHKDLLAPRISQLAEKLSPGYLEHINIAWRHCFRALCKAGLLDLAYGRCVIPSDGKDVHDPDAVDRGLPEAWLGVYPLSIMPKHTLPQIESNSQVPAQVKSEYLAAIETLGSKTNGANEQSTLANHWFAIRQLAKDTGIQSLNELGSIPGAGRLAAYFKEQGYMAGSTSIRRLRTIFRALGPKGAGLLDDPYEVKLLTTHGGSKYAIDFSELPKESTKSPFLMLNGKRHVRTEKGVIEARLRPEDIETVARYRNPKWKEKGLEAKPVKELEGLFRELQEDTIAFTCVCIEPPRPCEIWADNWGEWERLEGDNKGRYISTNNYQPYHNKKRPGRVLPGTYVNLLEELERIRRALFSKKGNVDQAVSRSHGMIHEGIPRWAHPKTGKRLSPGCIKKAIRNALLRMGVDPIRAKNATVYWGRKGQATYLRLKSKGLGDKFTAEQAGHDEKTLRDSYDGPEAIHRADFLEQNLWNQSQGASQSALSSNRNGSPGSESQGIAAHLMPSDLKALALGFYQELETAGIVKASFADDIESLIWKAALKTGLLLPFKEAQSAFNNHERTLERWADDGHAEIIKINGNRYMAKATINRLLNYLSPEQTGYFMNRTARQVRNIAAEGKLKIAFGTARKFSSLGHRSWPTRKITACQPESGPVL
ncbi:MAG: hypothetical protein AAB091_06835 [Elusimicrobiota bacterium]